MNLLVEKNQKGQNECFRSGKYMDPVTKITQKNCRVNYHKKFVEKIIKSK